MKLRKILIMLAVMALMITSLAIFVNAEAVEILFGLNHFESVVANEDNGRKDVVDTLFDGDITDGGIYDAAIGWYGYYDDYILITFPEETVVTKMIAYLTGNWTMAEYEFFNANGERVHLNDDSHANRAYGPTGEPFTIFEAIDEVEPINVKQIKITVKELKWNGHVRTYKISELEIFGMHEHKYTEMGEMVKVPTCAEEGMREYLCNCGDAALFPVEPHGNHTTGKEMVVFRNGFTSEGYKATVCLTCSTMDTDITDTIGPLFTSLGYSVREDGTAGIQFGFSVNYDNVQLFNELSDTPLQFGTVTGSRAVLTEGNPMQLAGLGVEAVNDTVIAKDYTETGYDIISCKLSGFGEALYDTQLILSAYVYDGYNIYYLGDGTTSDVITKSYNDIVSLSAVEK